MSETHTNLRKEHLPFAIHLPLRFIETGEVSFDPDWIIVTVCGNGGGRSEKAANYLLEKNNSKAYFLEGGTIGWFNFRKHVIEK